MAIYRILGGLPLALDIAAAHIGRRLDATLAAYRQELLARGALDVVDDRKGRLDANALYTRHTAAVTATLAEQWQGLAHENARLLLQVAALLPEASIIRAHGWRCWRGHRTAGGFFGTSWEQAMDELVDASLLKRLRRQSVQLHPLVAAFAAIQTPEHERAAFRWRHASGCWSPTMTLPCCKVSAPHVGSTRWNRISWWGSTF